MGIEGWQLEEERGARNEQTLYIKVVTLAPSPTIQMEHVRNEWAHSLTKITGSNPLNGWDGMDGPGINPATKAFTERLSHVPSKPIRKGA
jgi:hypothetical protein